MRKFLHATSCVSSIVTCVRRITLCFRGEKQVNSFHPEQMRPYKSLLHSALKYEQKMFYIRFKQESGSFCLNIDTYIYICYMEITRIRLYHLI